MGFFSFLKGCWNTEMYSRGERWRDIVGKYFCLTIIFVVVIGYYAFLAWIGYVFLKDILEILFSNNQLNQWIWIVYGLILGMVVSIIFQSMPKEGRSPRYVLFSLMHHSIFIFVFIYAIIIWLVIIRTIHFFGII